jgi:hypothetical protein
MLSPWVIFLMGALFQPFLRASRDYRRQLLIAWLWFVIIFVILSIPAARHPRFILPLLPAGALLVGQLFAFHIKLAQERQEDPGVNLLRVPHWLLLAIASVVGPLFIIYQPELMAAKWMESPELPNIGTLAAAGLGVALLLITLLGARWHFKWQPRMAFYATVAWMVTASSICFHSYAQSYHFRNLHKEDAPRVAAHASADRDIVILLRDKEPPLTDEFLYYLGRVVRRIEPTDLPAISQSPKLTLVVTVDQPDVEAMMKHAGFIEVMKFSDGVARKLYLSAAPAKPK